MGSNWLPLKRRTLAVTRAFRPDGVVEDFPMSIAQHLAQARRLAVLYEDALEHNENEADDRCGEISADAMDGERGDGVPADGRGMIAAKRQQRRRADA